MRIAELEQTQNIADELLCEAVDMSKPTVAVQKIMEADEHAQGWQAFASAEDLLKHMAALANG